MIHSKIYRAKASAKKRQSNLEVSAQESSSVDGDNTPMPSEKHFKDTVSTIVKSVNEIDGRETASGANNYLSGKVKDAIQEDTKQ